MYLRITLACALMAALVWGKTDAMQDKSEPEPLRNYDVGFQGPGQLVTVWSWGPNRPDGSKALVITGDGTSRALGVSAPMRARWLTPRELIVEQFVRPMKDGSSIRVVSMSVDGEILDVLSDRSGLAGSEPAPGGRWLALRRYNQSGVSGMEVRARDGFRLETFHPRDQQGGAPGSAVWSPDASQLAVTFHYPSGEAPGRLEPGIAIATRDKPGFTRLMRAELEHGAVPLFWTVDGIYVRTHRDLARCATTDSTCDVVYSPGEHLAVTAGVPLSTSEALLLARDLSVDPFDARAKEIHQVDLTTGAGRAIVQLPDGAFIADLDWIESGR